MKGKTSFDRLLRRYVRGRLSGEDKAQFDAWLDSDKTDIHDPFAWNAEDEQKLFRKITGNIDRRGRRARDGWWISMRLMNPLPVTQWIKMAATVLVLLTASYGIWFSFKDMMRARHRIAGSNMRRLSPCGKATWCPFKKLN